MLMICFVQFEQRDEAGSDGDKPRKAIPIEATEEVELLG